MTHHYAILHDSPWLSQYVLEKRCLVPYLCHGGQALKLTELSVVLFLHILFFGIGSMALFF